MLDLRPTPFDHPDAVALIEQVQAEYVARYGGPDRTPLDAGVFAAGSGGFYVGYRDGVPVAMGGWRFRPDVQALGGRRAAEIKRMYVAPGHRRGGLARSVLAGLEDAARAAGADVMVLETGLAQPEAIALYEVSGYVEVEGFGLYRDSPLSRCYGRVL